jgi:S-DNA-T family DNA segregation ATPase FtsK/SpoIIIE
MLYSGAQDPFPIRMQGAFVSEEEVERAVEHVKTLGEPEYIDDEIFFDDEEENAEPGLFDDGESDPLFEKALEIVMQQGKASASYIQRRLKIGYNRSARLVELMEERGIVGPAQGSKPRDILRNPELFQDRPDAGKNPQRGGPAPSDSTGADDGDAMGGAGG